LTQVHSDNLLFLFLHLNCPTDQSSLPFGYLFWIFPSGCIPIKHLHNTDSTELFRLLQCPSLLRTLHTYSLRHTNWYSCFFV
jgi:hypothetical protein